MGVLDGPMGAVAKTLVGAFGRPAQLLVSATAGAYNPATGNVEGASTPASYPCEVVFAEFTDAQIDGTTIKAGDRKAIVSRLRLGVKPVPLRDTLAETGNSYTWQIIRLMGYSSGEQEAAYQLHVRR